MKIRILATLMMMLMAASLWSAGYQVTIAVGKVDISRDNGKTWSAVPLETDLSGTYIIRTAAGARCEIAMPGAGTYTVGEKSQFVLSKVGTSSSSARLKVGAVVAKILKKRPSGTGTIKVDTDVATAAVRGTEFSVETDGKEVKTSVKNGTVTMIRNVKIPASGAGLKELKKLIEVDVTANEQISMTMAENKALETTMKRAKKNMKKLKEILSGQRSKDEGKKMLMDNADRVLDELSGISGDTGEDVDPEDSADDVVSGIKDKVKGKDK